MTLLLSEHDKDVIVMTHDHMLTKSIYVPYRRVSH